MPLQGIPSIMHAGIRHAAGAINIGFNFRATSGFVTDGANETYVLAEAYPTTRAGFTFGWVQTGAKPIAGADRDNTAPPELAGINYCDDWNGTTETYFRLDITPGTYNVRLAAGDTSFAGSGNISFNFKDTTTSRFIASRAAALSAGQFIDATSTLLTTATWVGSNTAVSMNISTGQLRVTMGDGSGATIQEINCIQLASA